MLIASGCVNRYPPIPGLNDVNFQNLRNIKDYEEINDSIRKNGVKNITIIGGGFIGMEAASAIKLQLKDAVNVTVIERASTTLEHVLGKNVGKVLEDLATKNGINVITNANVKEIKSDNRNPKSVVLDDQEVAADVLIMSTGVKCSIDFAENLIDPDTHGIKTNAFL